ncbi:MAG: efflux RND transporter periplasmic adaptor subunit [Pirellulales bacterium]|nr:efflux RND transporter periplasmic adaptor subunit [Pirellulales bacterium]
MRTFLIAIVLAVVGGLGTVGVLKIRDFWRERHKPTFHEAKVARGEIVAVVNSTGTVQPVIKVPVGTFVSGPIKELLADFNDHVKEKQLMAQIDPRIYKAAVARDEASLATARAELARVTALRQQAINDERRAEQLRKINPDYLAESAMDQYRFARQSYDAQLDVAHAAIKQAEAMLENSEANLEYTNIRSPVDGIVIARRIDEGQTLAAQFATPELFIVAPRMEEEMYVYASVDEADIGMIREAQRQDAPVEFTVDTCPEDLFKGRIAQVRMDPTVLENVVTYPVVVTTPNPDLKLMPGMTASISFRVGQKSNVLKIPNAALRFYPKPEFVHPDDKDILEGASDDEKVADNEEEGQDEDAKNRRSASQKADAGRKRHQRHVWVLEDNLLRAVPVTIGLSDNEYTELVKGDLKEGQALVTRVEEP